MLETYQVFLIELSEHTNMCLHEENVMQEIQHSSNPVRKHLLVTVRLSQVAHCGISNCQGM